MPFPKLNRGPSQARHARADFYDLQVFISPPGLALRATSKTCHCAQQSYRPRLEVAAATSSGAVLQAEEERAEGPHYTRITETPAKCPFAGTKSFSTKETDYQSWKVRHTHCAILLSLQALLYNHQTCHPPACPIRLCKCWSICRNMVSGPITPACSCLSHFSASILKMLLVTILRCHALCYRRALLT